jgi:hypothetical protein
LIAGCKHVPAATVDITGFVLLMASPQHRRQPAKGKLDRELYARPEIIEG